MFKQGMIIIIDSESDIGEAPHLVPIEIMPTEYCCRKLTGEGLRLLTQLLLTRSLPTIIRAFVI